MITKLNYCPTSVKEREGERKGENTLLETINQIRNMDVK